MGRPGLDLAAVMLQPRLRRCFCHWSCHGSGEAPVAHHVPPRLACHRPLQLTPGRPSAFRRVFCAAAVRRLRRGDCKHTSRRWGVCVPVASRRVLHFVGAHMLPGIRCP